MGVGKKPKTDRGLIAKEQKMNLGEAKVNGLNKEVGAGWTKSVSERFRVEKLG